MKSNFLMLMGLVALLTSCSDRRLIKYNETKVFPITVEMSESFRVVSGELYSNDLKKLFDIPSDGKVESLKISGLSLVVERLSTTEADLISYALLTRFGDDGDLDTLLNRENRDVSSFFGVRSFNVSNELNPTAVKKTMENLELILKEPLKNYVLKYSLGIRAKDFTGNLKKFDGKVTGQIHCQVVYSVCESFPEGVFSEYPKCE